MSISAIDIMVGMEANCIVSTKKVVLLHSTDKQHFEERLSKDELDLLFLIECRHCEPGVVFVITDSHIARGFVECELRRQRESEVSGNEYVGE